jgi:transposase
LDFGSLFAQQSHGERHQTCLAHLARDTAFAFEHGCDDLPLRFKPWLGRAFDLAKHITSFAASTLASKKRSLEKQLAALLAAPTGCDLARELQAKVGRARHQLLTFCDFRHQWLPRQVGGPSRGRRANHNRHRTPPGRQSLRSDPRYPGLTLRADLRAYRG